ncbi:MAG: NADH:ubiquinone oxidoreductase subunit NDUFA12 [Alphaproteobacteria bacterium]|nr:MAG: NADH:ubiquinone oxidoreductase subunit NDUFA12 [Alphaproteobacteria bacterium]
MASVTLGTRLFTWLYGEEVGRDEFGNRYYREKGGKAVPLHPESLRRERRWVIYAGEAEPSAIPPQWHAWLHHTVDEIPDDTVDRRAWQKTHVPNPTGTDAAYRPAGHVLAGGRRASTTSDYEPWTPQ